jgi:sterol 3beta-glucosyltransferase
MKALLLTVGSQGDIQPFVALACRLRNEGHEAVLCAPALFGDLAGAHDIPFAPLDLDMLAVGEELRDSHGPRHFVKFARAMGNRAPGLLTGATTAAAAGADVIVHHPVLPVGQHLAEWLGVPAVVAPPQPAFVPTREFASPAWSLSWRPPRALNRPSYRAATQLAGAWSRGSVDRWRRDVLGLPVRVGRHDPLIGADGTAVPVLHSFSSHVVPAPADWPSNARVTGYWFPPVLGGWEPPRRLSSFLDEGEAPVYIGFGSMPVGDPGRLAADILVALDRTGTRAVVATWSPEMRRSLPGSRVLVIRSAPHNWLFPRVSAVVHHGGAGTTATAAAAGRPQVICPFGVDQPFWAHRMRGLGVAPAPVPMRILSGSTLGVALEHAVGDPGARLRAEELGSLIRAEDGTGQAVAYLESILGAGRTIAGAVRS